MSTTSTVRVVVVEDHPVTRMGVVALLGQDERIEVVGEAGAGEDALGVVARISRPQADLSAREVEILAAVARGLSNREIARALVISEATVKTHLVHVFTKLDVDSRTAAVARAREDGLIP